MTSRWRPRLRVLLLVAILSPVAVAAPGEAKEAARGTLPKRHAEIGIASWYGREHAGHPMANGEIFDPNLMTAAHRRLPLGTRLRVTNLACGRSVIVTVTDRGPYVRRRFIDLSWEAATRLGMARTGLARVRIEILSAATIGGQGKGES